MQKIQNVLMKYLMPIANKLEQQKHIQAIKDGIVASIPIIIVGSFCTIFLGIANLLGSGPVYDFLNANMGVLTYASAFTNDMLAVYATYFIAKTLSEKYDLKGSQPAVTALVVFFILCAVVKDGQLNTSYLGSTGLFTGIVAALFTVEIYHICYERKWYIKMPESVPPMVQSLCMRELSVLNVLFFRTESGREPVRDWLLELDKEEITKKSQKTPQRELELARDRKNFWRGG